jgi:hypothetical protein
MGAQASPAPRERLTDRDELTLQFAAEQRLVLAAQVASLLSCSAVAASRRLQRLTKAGCLRHERQLIVPGSYQITRQGLALLGSPLRPPRKLDLAAYDHDVGMGWLWLAGHSGRFGQLSAVLAERELRSHDARGASAEAPLGIRLAGVGPQGGERRHYPDLLLETRSGHRVAVELELTPKGTRRLREIMAGYALDGRVDAVLYLVESPAMQRSVQAAAAAAGVSSLIHVQRVRFLPGAGAVGRGRGLGRGTAVRGHQAASGVATQRMRVAAAGREAA